MNMRKHRVFGILGLMTGFLIPRFSFVDAFLDRNVWIDIILAIIFATVAVYFILTKQVSDEENPKK